MDKKIYGKVKVRKYHRKYTHAKIVFLAFLIAVAVITGVEQYTIRHIEKFQPVTVNAQEPEKEEQMLEYVIRRFQEEGLDSEKALKIAFCESGFRADVVVIEPNKTISLGLFQINTIHKDISNAEKLDFKTAVEWTIKKVKKEGWSAWSCARKLGIR